MTTDAKSETTDTQSQRTPQPIVARPAKQYRAKRLLMVVILIGYGGWSIYDGFINWPNWKVTHPNEAPKTDMDIKFNQALGVILPILGVYVLFTALRNSRGEYRLENDTLYVPGHPPVPLDKITAADKELWDRKGIVYLEYEKEGPEPGKLMLDDYIYDRVPTDQIFEEVQASLLKTPAGQAKSMPRAKGFDVIPATPKAAQAAAARAQAAPAKPGAPAGAKPDMLKAKPPPRPKLG